MKLRYKFLLFAISYLFYYEIGINFIIWQGRITFLITLPFLMYAIYSVWKTFFSSYVFKMKNMYLELSGEEISQRKDKMSKFALIATFICEKIDLLVVFDGENFEHPWDIQKRTGVTKSGNLKEWKWKELNCSQAQYESSNEKIFDDDAPGIYTLIKKVLTTKKTLAENKRRKNVNNFNVLWNTCCNLLRRYRTA